MTRKGNSVSFPLGIADASIIMVQKATTTTFDPLLYLKTFDWWVWLAIIATYIISAFLYRFIHLYGEGEGEYVDRHSKLRKREVLYDSFMTLNQQNQFKPQSMAGRIFTFSLNFFSLVIIAMYTANLVTHMVLGFGTNPSVPCIHIQRGRNETDSNLRLGRYLPT